VLFSSAYGNPVSALVKTLYTTSMTKERLPGGYTTGAELIGDVIHRFGLHLGRPGDAC
jgi:hypothetical protein